MTTGIARAIPLALCAVVATISRQSLAAQQRADTSRPLAYYDSVATARSLGAEAAFRLPGDTTVPSIGEADVSFFNAWALAWLHAYASSDSGKAAVGALAIMERGRSHRLLDLRAPSQRIVNLFRVADGDPGAQGQQLIEWATAYSAKTSVLAYAITPDTLLIWLVQPSGVMLTQQAIPADTLRRLVAAARTAWGAGRADGRGLPVLDSMNTRSDEVLGATAPDWRISMAALGRRLLPAVIVSRLSAAGDLVIIPDGILGMVPFTALSTDTSGQLLGDRHALRYAPSLSALAATELGDGRFPFVNFAWLPSEQGGITFGSAAVVDSLAAIRSEWLRHALVVGNPTMPVVGTVALPQLAGAEEEARWVAAKLAAPVFTGAEARESVIRGLLPTATVVHIASHGLAYQSRTRFLQSFVALAPGDGDTGLLTVDK
ncbi:MAG TPA: CHAT domain-containing protein, partial [Gemmatimonadales bacterium]|nr:CHAT domain-containing protein [Gemmatimonadales bacterium]